MSFNSLSFHVQHAHISLLHLDEDESRGRNCLKLLERVVGLDPIRFHGKRGIIYFADKPPLQSQRFDLQFCSTKILGQSSPFLPFPCPHALSWPEIGLPDADALTWNLLTNLEPPAVNKVFWLGADTHPSRWALVQHAQRQPEIFDCQMMGWDRTNPERLTTPQYISLWDHRRYKYLVDCPGYGYSGRLKWLLASGRPVFIVERDAVEPWHDELIAWQHYIPVAHDLSDLLSAYRQVEASPVTYAHIARNAQQFARDYLLLERQLARCVTRVPRLCE